MGKESKKAWYQLEPGLIEKEFSTDFKNGLSREEAARRLEEDGPNELTKKEGVTLWDRIIAQLSNFLIIILIGAAIISGLLGKQLMPWLSSV